MIAPNSPPKSCPRCGSTLPANAPEGLCPRCVGALNLAEETVFTDPAAARTPPMSVEEIAPHFPQLDILECLGRGGMGVVYKARQKSLGRIIALKLLAPEREKDGHFAERFAREAQALAALNHPHIVTVHDFGQTNGFFYLLMEFVDGVNLRQLLRARKLAPEEALAIVPPLCEALQFAHERGIVHRDIKPENLLLDRSGVVKIADFGIAKMLGAETQMTEEKAVGTPAYMAPEQKVSPQRADSRADIYSMGVVLYEMLTGELPGDKLQPPSSRIRGMKIDVRVDEVVLKALEKAPEMRWQTAAEMGTRLETIVDVPPASASAGMARENSAVAFLARPWNADRKHLFWPVLLLVAYPLIQLIAFVYLGRWGWAPFLMNGNAVLLCLTLAVAVWLSLWEWVHTAPGERTRVWAVSWPWWTLVLVCALLPFILETTRAPLATPATLEPTKGNDEAAMDGGKPTASAPTATPRVPGTESAMPTPDLPPTETTRPHEPGTGDAPQKPEQKVPILSEIPHLGPLFRSEGVPTEPAAQAQVQQQPEREREVALDQRVNEMRERFALLLEHGVINQAEQERAELLLNLARRKASGGAADPPSQLEWKAVLDFYQRVLMREQAPPKASFTQDLVLTGLAKVKDAQGVERDFVTIKSRDQTQKFSLFGSEPNKDGISIVSVERTPEPGKSMVTLKKGNEVGAIYFDVSNIVPREKVALSPRAIPQSTESGTKSAPEVPIIPPEAGPEPSGAAHSLPVATPPPAVDQPMSTPRIDCCPAGSDSVASEGEAPVLNR